MTPKTVSCAATSHKFSSWSLDLKDAVFSAVGGTGPLSIGCRSQPPSSIEGRRTSLGGHSGPKRYAFRHHGLGGFLSIPFFRKAHLFTAIGGVGRHAGRRQQTVAAIDS